MAGRLAERPCVAVECYVPQMTAGRAADFASRLSQCTRNLSAGGEAVRFTGLVALPADEICFGLFEAGSADLVKRVLQLAGIDHERIVMAIQVLADGEEST